MRQGNLSPAADLPVSHSSSTAPSRMLTRSAAGSPHSHRSEEATEETDHLEIPPAWGRGHTYPIGIRQSRALLFSVTLELMSPGLFALRRDIVSTLNTKKPGICHQCFHTALVAAASAPPAETQPLTETWLRQELFQHQWKNYHNMKTSCWIQLLLVSLRTGHQCQQLVSRVSTRRYRQEFLMTLALSSSKSSD